MPESIVRRQKVKTERVNKVLKTVSTVSSTSEAVSTTPTKTHKTNERYSLVSDNKIKKILDEHRINKDVISVISKIKEAISNGKEFKTVLTEQEVDIVGEYFECNKEKIKKEEVVGKAKAKEAKTTFTPPSTIRTVSSNISVTITKPQTLQQSSPKVSSYSVSLLPHSSQYFICIGINSIFIIISHKVSFDCINNCNCMPII